MASTYQMVAYGSSGSAVRQLQEALNRHGYGLAVDGVFGEKTKAAVRDYQKRNGLRLDGVAGEETWGSLMAPPPAAVEEQTPAPPAVSPNTAAALEKLEQGFTPSADAEAARDYADSFTDFGEYESAFEAQLSALYQEMAAREDFSYDPAADAAFQSYLKRYAREGRAAMEDTVAKNAHLSGGYGSSYASSQGQAAYYDALARLGDVLPQLQEAAYRRYTDEGKALLERYRLLQSRDEDAYAQYLQQLKAWQSQRDAAREDYESLSAAERKQYQLLLDYFGDKAAAEGKGETTSTTTPTAVTAGATLSSKGAESLHKAMSNYLKAGDTAAASALYQRYTSRISPSQRSRFTALLERYGLTG